MFILTGVCSRLVVNSCTIEHKYKPDEQVSIAIHSEEAVT